MRIQPIFAFASKPRIIAAGYLREPEPRTCVRRARQTADIDMSLLVPLYIYWSQGR